MSLSEIQCPISREVFLHPLLCEDGFSYEESFITRWITRNKRSPMLGSILQSTQLRENRSLCAFIDVYKGMMDRLSTRRLPVKSETKEVGLPDALKLKFDTALGHYYKSTLELDECCKLMADVYNLVPLNFDVAINYGNILRFSTRFDKALLIIKTLKHIRSGTLIPKYMKVRILAESGKKDQAAVYLKNVAGKYRIEDHLLIDIRFMSYSLLSTGNRDLAFKIVSTYLKVVPNDTRAVSHFIYINLLKENYEFVIEAAEEYLKTNPDDISILFHQAKAFTRISQKKKAVEIYVQISKFSVDKSVKAKALYEAAVNRDNNAEFAQVVQELEESYNLDPKEEADGYLAALYADKKMYAEAEHWMNVCANRVNIMDDSVYLGIRVQIEEHKGQYDMAVSSYIRLAEIDGANSIYYNNKIDNILQKMNQSNKP
eukprot:TRINITY_DN7725_c0_g1_i10.p1 TRINITY_DN7725_c0_g1~~TRINITY_DN7725_c0_g1_i10.p1  ORF type:complete len:430 (-),score=138.22 TRINITY_DN7725_c0_g1_i10:97-1386(-)